MDRPPTAGGRRPLMPRSQNTRPEFVLGRKNELQFGPQRAWEKPVAYSTPEPNRGMVSKRGVQPRPQSSSGGGSYAERNAVRAKTVEEVMGFDRGSSEDEGSQEPLSPITGWQPSVADEIPTFTDEPPPVPLVPRVDPIARFTTCTKRIQKLLSRPGRLTPAARTLANAADAAIRRNSHTLDLKKMNAGELPPAVVPCLEFADEIVLSGNGLVSLPSTISSLQQLVKLNLNSNKLTCLPSEIGDLVSLEWLYVKKNKLAGLPSTIGGLRSLRGINASQNCIKCLPRSASQLQSLISLDLSENQMETLPLELGYLPALREVYLLGNPVQHSYNVGDCKALVYLLRTQVADGRAAQQRGYDGGAAGYEPGEIRDAGSNNEYGNRDGFRSSLGGRGRRQSQGTCDRPRRVTFQDEDHIADFRVLEEQIVSLKKTLEAEREEALHQRELLDHKDDLLRAAAEAHAELERQTEDAVAALQRENGDLRDRLQRLHQQQQQQQAQQQQQQQAPPPGRHVLGSHRPPSRSGPNAAGSVAAGAARKASVKGARDDKENEEAYPNIGYRPVSRGDARRR